MKDTSPKSNWKKHSLCDLAAISSGNSISAKDRRGKYFAQANAEGHFFISTKDVGFDGKTATITDVRIPPEAQAAFKLAAKSSTLVCSEGGSAGRKIGFLRADAHYGNKLFALTAQPFVEPKLIYYFCQTGDFKGQFAERMTGLIGGASLRKFQSIQMPLPPLEEQRRIVAFLDKAFEGLDRARANAEANLKDAQEVFERSIGSVFDKLSGLTPHKQLQALCTDRV